MKKMKDKLIKILKNPGYIFIALSRLGFFKKMNDEKYLCIVYKIRTGKTLNLENPKTFNEKLQWLKLYDRKIEYTTMVDKYADVYKRQAYSSSLQKIKVSLFLRLRQLYILPEKE